MSAWIPTIIFLPALAGGGASVPLVNWLAKTGRITDSGLTWRSSK